MKTHYKLAAFAFLLCLSSCSFNKLFYQPDKIPANAKGQTVIFHDMNDTFETRYTGDNHQPVFTKNRKSLDLGFNIESVVFKSANGSNLNGWMLKSGKQNAKVTILHLHGNAGNLYSQYQLIAPLVSKGFQVFMLDYSGYGFSDGHPTKKTTLTDALSAVDYLKTREDVKNTKLVIYGQSTGGYIATVAAEQRQNVIDGLAIEGAMSSRKDMVAWHARKVFMPGFLGRALVNQTYSAKISVRKYHKPLLVIHSTEDKEAPFSMGKTIFNNANSPKAFYEIKGPHIRGVQLYPDSIAAKINLLVNR